MGKFRSFLLVLFVGASAQAADLAYVTHGGGVRGGVYAIDTNSGIIVKNLEFDCKPRSVAIRANGADRAYVGVGEDTTCDLGNQIVTVDTTSMTVVSTLSDGVGTEPGALALSPDDSKLYIATNQGLQILDTTNGQLGGLVNGLFAGKSILGISNHILSVGHYVNNSVDSSRSGLSLLSASGTLLQNVEFTGDVGAKGVAFDGSGQRVYVTSEEGDKIYVFDLDVNDALNPLTQVSGSPYAMPTGSRPYDLVLSSDASTLFVAYSYADLDDICSTSGYIARLDAGDLSQLSKITLSKQGTSGKVSPMGIDMRHDGSIYVLKNIWCGELQAGFLSIVDNSNGGYAEVASQMIFSGRGAYPQTTDQFLASPCAACPDGDSLDYETVKPRPAAMSPWLLLLITPFYFLRLRRLRALGE